VLRTSRIVPSPRSLLKLAGAGAVGLAVAAAFAAPAFACDATVDGKPGCSNGTANVTWTIHNDWNTQATTTITILSPNGSVLDHSTVTVPAAHNHQDGTATVVQSGITGGDTARVHIKSTWAGQRPTEHDSLPVKTSKDCKPSSPSPSPSMSKSPEHSASPSVSASASPSRSTGGGGGGAGSPTPSSSASTPSLPLTGTNTAMYAGGAVVLIAAGGTLFFLARRRRIKFEA
jgi:LPXTG-motif cell wall-anchored protein